MAANWACIALKRFIVAKYMSRFVAKSGHVLKMYMITTARNKEILVLLYYVTIPKHCCICYLQIAYVGDLKNIFGF